ncbi:hypothetical protein [Streptomyces sp. NPDC047014]|uniref:hypothetical protein n=1 Tax=Streptomyces sp. NPDC047014 TaxID=3155736 RepID=UPI0033D6E7EA
MLALRLARGSRPVVQARRLLVAAASAGTGFLLLWVLASAVDRPAGSFPRLLWALIPVAVTVHLAVTVARADPATRPREGLDAAGLGPVRLGMAAAISTAVACALGSAVALAVFLHLRGDLSGLPFDGAGARLLHGDQPLPLAAALTLLALVPLAASAATVLALRPHRALSPQAALPWGITLTACGFAVEAYGGRGLGMLAGWSLTAVGLALAGPGLAHAGGSLLQAVRPGGLRLLAGRALQEQAPRIGPALGVLCSVAAGALTALALRDRGGLQVPLGPLTWPAVTFVALCATATLLTSAVEGRRGGPSWREALLDLGAPAKVLRTAAGLRATALVAVCLPLSFGVAQLTSLALTR